MCTAEKINTFSKLDFNNKFFILMQIRSLIDNSVNLQCIPFNNLNMNFHIFALWVFTVVWFEFSSFETNNKHILNNDYYSLIFELFILNLVLWTWMEFSKLRDSGKIRILAWKVYTVKLGYNELLGTSKICSL